MLDRYEIIDKVEKLSTKSMVLYNMLENGKIDVEDLYDAYLAHTPIDIELIRNVLFSRITKFDEKQAIDVGINTYSKEYFLTDYVSEMDFDLNDSNEILTDKTYIEALNFLYTKKIVNMLDGDNLDKSKSRIELVSLVLDDIASKLDEKIRVDINRSFLAKRTKRSR